MGNERVEETKKKEIRKRIHNLSFVFFSDSTSCVSCSSNSVRRRENNSE